MRTILNPVDAPAHDAFVEKKSEFIGDAAHVDSLDEAIAFVGTIRDRHPKARHVAYAAVVGGSDDVLRANGLTDCVVAVTRYFGGILLGSGGLIRAYSTGASIAVKAAQGADIVPCQRYLVTLEYPQLARFQQLLAGVDGVQSDETYAADITLTATLPLGNASSFEDRVRETFNATISPEPIDTVNRAIASR